MPVSTRVRPLPSSASVSLNAVSVVVRRLVASRPGAGPGSAPSARSRTSFSEGRRTETRIPSENARTTMPCASRRSARGSSVRTKTKFVAVGGASKPAAASATRMRSRSSTVSRTSSRRGARRAAAAIAAAGPEIGAGARRSSRTAAVSGCASAYPTRSEASPNAFESVRSTTRLGVSSTHRAQDAPPYSR